MAAPVIGFTLDYEETPTYSKLPWYAIRDNYCASVAAHGALPVCLPHEEALANDYLDMMDGLIVTGGAFDVSPALYGQADTHDTVVLKERRTRFEWAVLEGALKRNMPVFGICGGQQLLAVVLGGTLIQHIPDSIENCLAHEQPNPRHDPGHSVTLTPGTLLHTIVGEDVIDVNSAHHQAVATAGEGCLIDAIAPDGVIEGIEYPEHPFCLGVQWHPEYHVTEHDDKLFAAFVAAANDYKAQKA